MKKIIFSLLSFILLGTSVANAQNEKFKALFMYNFTKYIEWPASARQGDFVIGVLGNSAIAKELEIIATKQKVGSQNIVVKVFNSPENIDNCHILFLPSGKSALIGAVTAKLSGKNTLLITDKEGLAAQGSAINYISDGDKIKFEVCKRNIDKNGLIVNSALIALGASVN